jgi:hypothetical protein
MGRFLMIQENQKWTEGIAVQFLTTRDEAGEFQQKCRFRIRKPAFYPLNYGDGMGPAVTGGVICNP